MQNYKSLNGQAKLQVLFHPGTQYCKSHSIWTCKSRLIRARNTTSPLQFGHASLVSFGHAILQAPFHGDAFNTNPVLFSITRPGDDDPENKTWIIVPNTDLGYGVLV